MSSKSHKELAYKSDMGHKAVVDRQELKSQNISQANNSLALIGKHLEPPGIKYAGTAAVHVYIRKGIIGDELTFICQAPLVNNVMAPVADDALLELTKQVKYRYTGKMETKRSGF